MWIQSHFYDWSVWLFLDWQKWVCDLSWSTHIAIGDLSDCSLIARKRYVISSDLLTLLFGDLSDFPLIGRKLYVISSNPLPLLLVICLTVPWLAESGMWSILIQSHCYWWSVWMFLNWQAEVCDTLIHSHCYWWSVWLFLDLMICLNVS